MVINGASVWRWGVSFPQKLDLKLWYRNKGITEIYETQGNMIGLINNKITYALRKTENIQYSCQVTQQAQRSPLELVRWGEAEEVQARARHH